MDVPGSRGVDRILFPLTQSPPPTDCTTCNTDVMAGPYKCTAEQVTHPRCTCTRRP